MTLAQSAMLAAWQSSVAAGATTHLARAQKRSRLVLQAMADTGLISQA